MGGNTCGQRMSCTYHRSVPCIPTKCEVLSYVAAYQIITPGRIGAFTTRTQTRTWIQQSRFLAHGTTANERDSCWLSLAEHIMSTMTPNVPLLSTWIWPGQRQACVIRVPPVSGWWSRKLGATCTCQRIKRSSLLVVCLEPVHCVCMSSCNQTTPVIIYISVTCVKIYIIITISYFSNCLQAGADI